MIIVEELKKDKEKKIDRFLIEMNIEDLNKDGIIYIVEEDNELIGAGKVEKIKEDYFLNYLIIKNNKRKDGLGDGLLRAILSKLDNNGVDKLYYKEKNKYLLNKGFKENNGLMEIDIIDFFNKACKGCDTKCPTLK